jgi:hypothetical protein
MSDESTTRLSTSKYFEEIDHRAPATVDSVRAQLEGVGFKFVAAATARFAKDSSTGHPCCDITSFALASFRPGNPSRLKERWKQRS